MGTPLQFYTTAVDYLLAVGRMHPDRMPELAIAQSRRVVQELNGVDVSQRSATELLEVLGSAGASCPFTMEQRESISDAVQSKVDGEDPAAVITNRPTCKEQEHLFLHEYLPQLLWDTIRSDDSLKNKFKHVVHFCVETLQLRNASPYTRRNLVALVHEASGLDKDPTESFTDFNTVTELFRLKRNEISGVQSLKTFSENPQQFISRYPGAYPDDKPPVKCPVSKKEIKARSTKASIPCRGSNAKVSGNLKKKSDSRQPSTTTSIAPTSSADGSISIDPMQLLATCLGFMQGKSNVTPQGFGGIDVFRPGDPRARGEPTCGESSEGGGTHETSTALVGRKDTLPGCLAAATAGGAQGNLAALREKVKADLAAAPSNPKSDPADAENAGSGADEEADDDDDDGDTAASGKPARKKPAAKTAGGRTTSATKVMGSPGKPAGKSKVPMKSKGPKSMKAKKVTLDGDANPTAIAVLKRKLSCMKFASAMMQLEKHKAKKRRPKLPKSGTPENAEYMSGHIYSKYRKQPVLRVYTRKGDTHEQRFPYDPNDKGDMSAKWHLACSAIELDPRKVDK